ncbi:PIG-L family deacetylase [Methylobacterium sp. C25]|uniref:PIG-L deacetylase family protein n=1 Tax=Methylobacterium sp. C25 TaxID=2721622 RepID=UPI001F293755|nr:PIG-L family deacetylase [Methylobacterium sp. C25]MCE4226631.1 PIG-L family deacetylase [Methylobacterium sp. C25]
MRADAFFATLDRLPVASLDAILDRGGLVVVAPHPDDESLGCGGLITLASAANRPVRLVVLSDGCGSHTHSLLYPPERLRALREVETLAAVAELGLASDAVRFLRLPDAGVPSKGPQAEAAAGSIVEAAHACGAGAVCVTWGRDPHCDHQAAAAIVALARPRLVGVRIFAYPVWGHTLPAEADVGAPPRGVRLDVTGAIEAKRQAVAAHASQTTALIADDPGGFRLEPAMIDRLCGPYEPFIAMSA